MKKIFQIQILIQTHIHIIIQILIQLLAQLLIQVFNWDKAKSNNYINNLDNKC
jgi:hypothetical protein